MLKGRSCTLWILQAVSILMFLALCIFLDLRTKGPALAVLYFFISTTINCSFSVVSEECVTFYRGQDVVVKNKARTKRRKLLPILVVILFPGELFAMNVECNGETASANC
ncbi:hypothetical protein SLEP1_g29628 [Rubroshorea leprosula]|uniref:Uncharacterized protein n=1 Tax=Rubroshorea leprosula TaxID=152421 RepID=A0AAV5K5U1_9ROSI|nr:hypothetical protein SLEP1_g29628 [Rubroshorea leprosula]